MSQIFASANIADRRRPAADSWMLLQLADSAFPTGGFAHSAGTEAAWQHGELRNSAELRAYFANSLRQATQAAAPFVVTAYSTPGRIAELDELCDVWTTNHVANRASRSQGKAFISAVERIFEIELRRPRNSRCHGHYAPWFGCAAEQIGLGLQHAMELFCFNHLRGLVSSAVRLGIVGPTEGQQIQHSLSPALEAAAATRLTLEDLAQTAPLIDLWQGAQDRLYSRLFQS